MRCFQMQLFEIQRQSELRSSKIHLFLANSEESFAPQVSCTHWKLDSLMLGHFASTTNDDETAVEKHGKNHPIIIEMYL